MSSDESIWMPDWCPKNWGNFYPGPHCKKQPGHDGDHECGCGDLGGTLPQDR